MRLLAGYVKPIVALAITPDGSRLYSVAKGQSKIWEWDLASGEVVRKLRCRHERDTLIMSPRGDWLVSGGGEKPPMVLTLGDGEAYVLAGEDYRCLYTQGSLAIDSTARRVVAPYHEYLAQRRGLQLWDVASGELLGRITDMEFEVGVVAFAPDGTLAGTHNDEVRLWDVETGRCRSLIQERGPTRLAFHPEGEDLAVAWGHLIAFWRYATGELLDEQRGHKGEIRGFAYSPDGKYLASAALDGVVILRDSKTHEIVGQRHLDIGKLTALVWRADSAGLVIGGEKLIAVCDLGEILGASDATKPRGDPLSLAGHKKGIEAIAYSPDGRALASAAQYQLCLWDMSAGAGQVRLKSNTQIPVSGYVRGLSWSPDGRRVAVALSRDAQIYDAETGEMIRDYKPAGEYPWYLAYTPSGRVIAFVRQTSWQAENRVSIHEPDLEQVLFEVTILVGNVCYRPQVFGNDERVYFSTKSNHDVSRWTPATGKVVELIQQKTTIMGLEVSADERMLVTLGGNHALVWSLPQGKQRLELKHPMLTSGLALLPGGRLLTACYDGLVRMWDLSGGAELFAWELGMGRVYSLAVSPDHMTFAAGVAKGNRIVLMDVPD